MDFDETGKGRTLKWRNFNFNSNLSNTTSTLNEDQIELQLFKKSKIYSSSDAVNI